MKLFPRTTSAATFRPFRYQPDGIGAWSGHIPFAYDLIDITRPSVLVELGAYYGESYFAFCQAIAEHNVACSAWAVDTWQGDSHTGDYGEDVFAEVLRHNRTYYEPFSKLLRMTFDEAAERFAPDSIDLLHIDGFHVYDAVRHDFETWLPKVKPCGIVLFHDVAVRQNDFGVWRYWEELKSRYETFEFEHSHGLGVLRKPGRSSRCVGLDELLRSPPGPVREYYELCAERLAGRMREESEHRGEIKVNSQLFWRLPGGAFQEAQSVRKTITIEAASGVFRWSFPVAADAPDAFRLDLTDRPATLEVSAVALCSPSGTPVWTFDPRSPEYYYAGVRVAIPADSGSTFLMNAAGRENSIVVPIPEQCRSELHGGGLLEAHVRYVRTPECLEQAFAGFLQPREATAPPEDVRKLRAAFSHAEQLAYERLDELVRYDKALGEAQRIVIELERERAHLKSRIRGPKTDPGPAGRLYLDLMKMCLTRLLFPDCAVDTTFRPTGMFDRSARENGQDWPNEADTMIGLKRLTNVEQCVLGALADNVPGDLVETGVWRGGASILMRATLAATGVANRLVWVVDSFQGLPRPDAGRYPADAEDRLFESNAYLGVSLETVQANFAKYGLLDDRVRFLKGWFKDTLPSARIGRIAVLRLDGDMYESTMDVLENLYPKLSPGGYVIIDDYGALENCRKAVHDYRERHGIKDEIVSVDWTGVYWRRSRRAN